jgi:hypothetical protein
MTHRITQHHPRDLVGLKTSFDLLIASVGGGLPASAVLGGYSPGRLSEAASPHNAERWPRVDHIAELERVARRPIVTEVLAQLSGHTLQPIGAGAGTAGEALLGVVRGAGQVVSTAAEAMGDGAISPRERLALREQLAGLARDVDRALAVLAALAPEGR